MYKPRIFIRGYGTPSARLLAFSGSFILGDPGAALKRHLILNAEGADTAEPYLLLSGDMTDGDDILRLSGAGNDLAVLTTNDAFRLFGPDVDMIYSIVFPVDTRPFVISAADIRLLRHYPLPVETAGYSVTRPPSSLLAQRLLAAAASAFVLTGQAANLRQHEYLALSGDMTDGDDLLLLSGDMQSGADFLTLSVESL